MNPETIIAELRLYNRWRRGDEAITAPDPTALGKLLDAAAESLCSLIARNTTLRRERSEARAEVAQLKGALALGKENSDAEYNELREERDVALSERDALRTELQKRAAPLRVAQARVEELEAEAERNAWTISPEMVQTRNDQLAAENAALRARVAELAAALREILRIVNADGADESYDKAIAREAACALARAP